jgi:hypothetical protein
MLRASALGFVTAFFAAAPAFGLVDARALLLGAPPEAASDDASPAIEPASAPVRFGAKDSWRLDVEGEWAGDLDAINFGLGRIGVAWFFVDHFEVALYATLGGAAQPGTDAFVYGGDLEFRWHFLAEERWSVFASAGCGLVGSTEPVPPGGTELNFTPCVGAGVTLDVWEGTRLYLSARWFHLSNASTSSDNPGFNGLGLWAGLSFAL